MLKEKSGVEKYDKVSNNESFRKLIGLQIRDSMIEEEEVSSETLVWCVSIE